MLNPLYSCCFMRISDPHTAMKDLHPIIYGNIPQYGTILQCHRFREIRFNLLQEIAAADGIADD